MNKKNNTKLTIKKVLIIDDEVVIGEMLSDILELKGFDVCVACSGREGLARVEEFKPDIIMLDLNMPGMDGFSVLEHLKRNKKTANIPVLIASISDNGSDIKKGYVMGAQKYFIKPFSPEMLLHAIDEMHMEKKYKNKV